MMRYFLLYRSFRLEHIDFGSMQKKIVIYDIEKYNAK